MLVGALAGIALALLDMASLFLGRAPAMTGLRAPNTPRQMAYLLFLGPSVAVSSAVTLLLMLCLFQALVRRAWLARLLLVLVPLAVALAQGEDPLTASVIGAIFGPIIVSVLVRFGLLSSATLVFTFNILRYAPLTLDWSVWYAGRSFAVLGLFVALLSFAFHTSLGGKPLFGKALLED